jgi:hypothetical protein
VDPLTELGHVDPPAAEVLDNAREALWSVVAAEALPPAESPARESQQQHLNNKREMPN